MNKSRIFLAIVVITVCFATFNFSEVQASPGAGAIWTTNEDCGDINQDINHYAQFTYVYINGANFDPGTYDWFIKGKPGKASEDPNGIVESGTFTVDSSGSFCIHPAHYILGTEGGEYGVNFGGKKDNYRVEPGVPPISY